MYLEKGIMQQSIEKYLVNFLKRFDVVYDTNIQKDFVVDNISVHKSKKYKRIFKCCPRRK
jgi:hypothetical protein